MGQIDDEGHTTVFGGGQWKVIKGTMVVSRGKKVETLYLTQRQKDTIVVVACSIDSKLWHRRPGHMSEKGMKLLASKGKIPNLESVDLGLCEDCIYGKQKMVRFSKTVKMSKAEKLELVHTDV